jgi:hypothetical protein
VVRKEQELFCGSLLRKGEVFAYVGSIQNLKDLKAGNNAATILGLNHLIPLVGLI